MCTAAVLTTLKDFFNAISFFLTTQIAIGDIRIELRSNNTRKILKQVKILHK